MAPSAYVMRACFDDIMLPNERRLVRAYVSGTAMHFAGGALIAPCARL